MISPWSYSTCVRLLFQLVRKSIDKSFPERSSKKTKLALTSSLLCLNKGIVDWLFLWSLLIVDVTRLAHRLDRSRMITQVIEEVNFPHGWQFALSYHFQSLKRFVCILSTERKMLVNLSGSICALLESLFTLLRWEKEQTLEWRL